MSLVINSYRCPKCGNAFSYFMKPSTRVRRGIRTPYLRCSQCGQLSLQVIDVPLAIWLWPLTAVVLAGAFFLVRTYLSAAPQIFSLLALGGLFVVFIVAVRRGMKLVAAEKPEEPKWWSKL